MRDFRRLDIWKRSMLLATNIMKRTNTFPAPERFGLALQMNKAAISIPSNIAEGCGRRTKADLVHFIHIAIGSSFELETQIEISFQNNYLNPAIHQDLITDINEIQRMMVAFKNNL